MYATKNYLDQTGFGRKILKSAIVLNSRFTSLAVFLSLALPLCARVFVHQKQKQQTPFTCSRSVKCMCF